MIFLGYKIGMAKNSMLKNILLQCVLKIYPFIQSKQTIVFLDRSLEVSTLKLFTS